MAVERVVMDYWCERPAQDLIEVEGMSPEAIGPYWCIVKRFKMEHPMADQFGLYGVRAFDPTEMHQWSKLDTESWQRHRLAILRPFLFHAPTATIHHPHVKAIYTDYFTTIMQRKVQGRVGGLVAAARRTGAKKINGSVVDNRPPIGTPYPPFTGLFSRFTSQNWAEICKTSNENAENIGGLYPPGSNNVSNNLRTQSPLLNSELATRTGNEMDGKEIPQEVITLRDQLQGRGMGEGQATSRAWAAYNAGEKKNSQLLSVVGGGK